MSDGAGKIRFRCPACGGKLAGDAALSGAIVHCPHCAAPTFFPVVHAGASSGGEVVPEAVLVAVELKGRCPACKAPFRVDSRAVGRRIPCPECGRRMAMPAVPPHPERLPSPGGGVPVEPGGGRDVEVEALPLTADEIAFLMAPVAVDDVEHDSEIDNSTEGRGG
ncbi:MAG: zinc-ribbon domain-containing protein [Lentisphaerae bacterium]|nr:zinc-ribbon domain-containing protein [Lentisphaerota bacterium]